VGLRTPSVTAIADVLMARDGLDAAIARWAASVCGGHVGRARRLATDPQARARREAVLRVPTALCSPTSLAEVFALADELVRAAESEASGLTAARDTAETAELETALGAGGTGKGAALAARGAKGALRELERRQKSRATRTQRDALDRALVDLASFYRDALVAVWGAGVPLTHPDRADEISTVAGRLPPEALLRRLEAVLACREALELNVKPRIAIEALTSALHSG
jgi:DNA polymerase-3 subunit delta'